jgi:hypothetical protein
MSLELEWNLQPGSCAMLRSSFVEKDTCKGPCRPIRYTRLMWLFCSAFRARSHISVVYRGRISWESDSSEVEERNSYVPKIPQSAFRDQSTIGTLSQWQGVSAIYKWLPCTSSSCVGVRSILATSRATFPWPITTATSPDRSGFNWSRGKFTVYAHIYSFNCYSTSIWAGKPLYQP